jgi:hypothetical protein
MNKSALILAGAGLNNQLFNLERVVYQRYNCQPLHSNTARFAGIGFLHQAESAAILPYNRAEAYSLTSCRQ